MEKIVEKIINDWDPIVLLSHAPKDEYKSEIRLVFDLLEKTDDQEELACGIKNVFVDWFGQDTFNDEKQKECIIIAGKLLEEKKAYIRSKDLNKRLLAAFPSLSESYDEETSWQEGDGTGGHVIFGNIFAPYIIENINKDSRSELVKIFTFIESLLEFDDIYIREVICLSVFETIMPFLKGNSNLLALLGERSAITFNELVTCYEKPIKKYSPMSKVKKHMNFFKKD